MLLMADLHTKIWHYPQISERIIDILFWNPMFTFTQEVYLDISNTSFHNSFKNNSIDELGMLYP